MDSSFEHSSYSISDVERDTGVPKETLRVWERRYSFPKPGRDANGERIYSAEQVQRLRLIKRLLDCGYRPGKIMHQSTDELAAVAAKVTVVPAANANDPELQTCLALIKDHKMVQLRQRMVQAQLQIGLDRFVKELVAPLTSLVGDAWAAGQLAVFEEHLYSDMLDSLMRGIVHAVQQQAGQGEARPRILLTTVPQERHGLGLLMAEALFALEGAHCISLGVQTPLAEIVEAARSQEADVVALSFSSSTSPRAAVDNVNELRARLGNTLPIWAGGSGAAAARRHLGAASVLDLDDIKTAVARWRQEQAGPARQQAA